MAKAPSQVVQTVPSKTQELVEIELEVIINLYLFQHYIKGTNLNKKIVNVCG